MSEVEAPEFAASAETTEAEALRISQEGFEGPLHLLLELARAHKVDLARISIAKIADDYLEFIEGPRHRDLDLAGEYLVMAAWLAWLKSRLLLPKAAEPEAEPSAQDLAERLRLRLLRLEAARAAAKRLLALPQLDQELFTFGAPQAIAKTERLQWRVTLFELLGAYAAQRVKGARARHTLRPRKAYPLAAARARLERLLNALPDWRPLDALCPAPEEGEGAPTPASYRASVLSAALELAREGKMDMSQGAPFAPLLLRARQERGS